jgi:hypothetical protein
MTFPWVTAVTVGDPLTPTTMKKAYKPNGDN